MQTMPSKNRMAIAISGIALLVVAGALVIWGVGQNAKESPKDNLAELGEQIDAAQGGLNPSSQAAANQGSSLDMGSGGKTVDADGDKSTTTAGGETDKGSLSTMSSVPLTHVVGLNETLYEISTRYYKTHVYAGDIEALNGIEDPNHLEVGQSLMLPRPEELTKAGQ